MSASRPRSGEPVVLPLPASTQAAHPWLRCQTPRRRRQREWDAIWADERNRQPWMDRGVAKEIVDAVTSGWFSRGSRSIDIGCGEGELSGYLAEQGFTAIRHRHLQLRRSSVPTRCTGVRQERRSPCMTYARPRRQADRSTWWSTEAACTRLRRGSPHVSAQPARMTRTGARMILFVRAFRDGVPFGHPAERDSLTRIYVEALGPLFRLVRSELDLPRYENGADPGRRWAGWCSGSNAPDPKLETARARRRQLADWSQRA